MNSIQEILDLYSKKSFDELVAIAKKDMRLMSQEKGDNKLGFLAMLVAFDKFAHFADWNLTKTEYDFFIAISGINQTYEELKSTRGNPKVNAINDKVINNIFTKESMKIKCLFLELCVCVSTCDKSYVYEWFLLKEFTPYEVVQQFEKYV